MTQNPTTVRANGESLRGYIAVFRGAQVLEATILQNAQPLSATNLSIAINSGSIADVQRGYRCQFFAADGTTFKGETHIRWSGTLDTGHLPVREFSVSEFLIVAGDLVRVFALMSFEDKLVENTELFNPDGQPVGTYNSLPPPLACSGGYDAGFVDGYETGTPLTFRTIETDGSGSLILDPNSTPGNLSDLWTRPAGVALAPGSLDTDASPVFRVDVGEHTVYHDVTDNDNAQTWRQCVTYNVYDGTTRSPVSVIMESPPTGTPEQGWSCTFRALDFLTLTDAPDGALVVFFVRQRINGVWQSLGGTPGRSAVKLAGYLAHDENDLTPQLQYQRFEVISPLARLGQLPGFSKLLIGSEVADTWAKKLELSTLRTIVQLMRIYTFVLDGGHDLNVSPFYVDYDYPEVWLQKESPRQQVDEIADGTDAYLTCSRTGLFRLTPQLPLVPPLSRVALTSVYTFARRDVLRMVARRAHFDTVETLELHATAAPAAAVPLQRVDDAIAVFSRAPGSPGHGAEYITIERIIATPGQAQSNANERAGRRYAMRNGVYTSSADGSKARVTQIDVEMREVYDFLDFDDTIVHFGAFPNPRDVDLTAFDWHLTQVRLDYASGKVISSFAPLTDAPAGESYFPPPAGADVPPPPPPVFPPNNPRGRNGLPGGLNSLVGINKDGFWYYTTTLLDPAGAVWARTAIPGLTGNLTDSVQDAYTLTRQIVVTDAAAGIYTVEGAYGDGSAMATTLRKTLRGVPVLRIVDASFGADFIVVKSYYAAEGTWACYSLNGGLTWSAEYQISAALGASPPSGLFVSSRAPGNAVVNAFLAVDTGELYTLSGAFGTITDAGIAAVAFPAAITKAWADNEATMFYSAIGGVSAQIFRKIGAAAAVDVTPVITGTPAYAPNNRSIHVAPTDANTVIAAVSSGTGSNWVVTSRDQGATWVVVFGVVGFAYDGAEVAGNDPDFAYCWGAGIATVDIATDTLTDRSGNLSSFTPGTFVRIRGV